MTSKPSAEQQETVESLLQAARRPTERVNVRHSFVQGPVLLSVSPAASWDDLQTGRAAIAAE